MLQHFTHRHRSTSSRVLQVAGRLGAVAILSALGVLTLAWPGAAANPTLTILSPQPLIAGRTVVLNGSGFTASTPVIFFWDGTESTDPPAPADQFGNLSGQAVSIPLSLTRGSHTLSACTEATPTTCASGLATAAVAIGPTITTNATMPVPRSSSVTITVGGEPPMTPSNTPANAVYRWNGAAFGGSMAVPDQPTFTITTTVPVTAPAHSTFEVCEDAGGGTCLPGTSGTVAFSVAVPAPSPSPSPTPRPSPSPSAAVPPVVASSSPTPSPHPSPSPTPSPTPAAPSQSAVSSPPSRPVVTTPKAAAPLYTPNALVHLEVAALALVTTLGVGAMFRGISGLTLPAAIALDESAAAAGAAGGAVHRSKKGGSASSAKVKAFKGGREATAAGDRSRTWQWPGTAALDSVVLWAPVRVARFSPLLARIFIDASYVRAIFGSLAILLPLGGLALGVAAARDTGGHVLPPSLGILTAIAVLGVFDAFAGFLAATVFTVAAAFTGDLETVQGLRMILGLGVVWFAAPLIAAATRPLRREPSTTIADGRRRVADLVLAALIGAWAVQKMIGGLPGLAGHPLPITNYAGRVALIVLAAISVRIALETAAARWYPLRLGEVQAASVPKASNLQRLLMAVVRTGVFIFFAVAFLGWHWQLWVGAAILLISQLLSIYEDKFRNFPNLYRWLPRGLTKLVLMLFIGAWFGALVLDRLKHDQHAAADAFLLLTIPGLVVTVVELHIRDGEEPEETWLRWLAGVGVLGLGLAFVFGYLQ